MSADLEEKNISLLLWCLSAQRVPAKIILIKMELVLSALKVALESQTDSVKSEALGCLLNICRQCPRGTLSFSEKWLLQVIFFSVENHSSVRDKAEHILAFMVAHIAENHELIDSVIADFFKFHSLAFGKALLELDCKRMFIFILFMIIANS